MGCAQGCRDDLQSTPEGIVTLAVHQLFLNRQRRMSQSYIHVEHYVSAVPVLHRIFMNTSRNTKTNSIQFNGGVSVSQSPLVM